MIESRTLVIFVRIALNGMKFVVYIFEAGLILDLLLTWLTAIRLPFHALHWGVLGTEALLGVWNALFLWLRSLVVRIAISRQQGILRILKLIQLLVDLVKIWRD